MLVLFVLVDWYEGLVFWFGVVGVWLDDFVVDVLFDDVCVLVGGVCDDEQRGEYCCWYVYYVVVYCVELVQIWEYFFDVLYYCFQLFGDVEYFQVLLFG